MNKLINGLPLFEAKVDMEDKETGMWCVSLVDAPAVERNFMAFEDNKKVLKYKVENEEQRKVFGLVMLADTPIYRRDNSGFEYYITYSKETIALMAEKYFRDGFQNQVDTQHNFKLEDGITLTQMFIKDIEKGVNPIGFEDVADGSLFGEWHIENDEVWNAIKDGTYKGFSLAGSFLIEEVEKFNKQYKIEVKKMNKIKEMLRKLLAEFGEVATDKGTLLWDGEDDLKEGDAVHTLDENGERKGVEDGEYLTEDKKIIIIKDGKVESITDPVAEVAPKEGEEEPKPVEGAEGETEPTEIEKIREEIDELYKLVDSILEKIGESRREADERFKKLENAPMAQPAEEAFEKLQKGDTKVDKMKQRGYRW